MNDITIKVGSRIRQIRNSKGVSQEKLSLTCGLNRNFIGQLERGEKNATIKTIKKICDALEISLHEFFSFELDEIDIPNDSLIKLSSIFKELSDSQITQIVNIVKLIITFQKP